MSHRITYGIPYMGSKSEIAASICINFHGADNFYDLFGGGFSITHYLLKNRFNDYKHFYFNEIKTIVTDVIKKAINGEYNYNVFRPKFIESEEFHRLKLTDGYIASCWSFGNNFKGYLFPKEIAEYKRSMHNAIVFDDFDDLATIVFGFKEWPKDISEISLRRDFLRKKITFFIKTKIPEILKKYIGLERLQQFERLERLEQLKQLKQLQQLERLERLQKLQQLEPKLTITNLDYRDVNILPNSFVYCDIPYQGTKGYENNFSHPEFLDWAAASKHQILISEYSIDDTRFAKVYSIDKMCTLSPTNNSGAPQESLYANKAFLLA